jgi:hypothetical protein
MNDDEKKTKRAEYARQYRKTHKDTRTADERREQKRTWRQANREKLAAQQRAYMAAHPEQRARAAEYDRKHTVAHRIENAVYQREWKRKNPERARAIARRTSLKAKYGITPDEFDALLAQQEGRCAICRSKDPGGHTRRKGERGEFHVDHDHATGERRGLLCRKCNAGIGQLGDSVERLEAALEYLKRHQT